MAISVVEVWRVRVLAYNNSGGVVASSVCSEDEVEHVIESLTKMQGVRFTHTTSPMLIRREAVEDE